MSLYSDLPPASDDPSRPAAEAAVPAPVAAASSATRPADDKATAGWSAKPPLLIPQINIVRQKPRPAAEAPRKKPLMMKVVKPAAPIVNMAHQGVPPAPIVAEGRRPDDEPQPHEEYDPAVPNEYLQLCRERRAERDRLQRERELQEFLAAQEAKQERQPVAPLELNVSGEDAYMRRMRMSGMMPAPEPEAAEPAPLPPSPTARSPSPEPYSPPVSVSTTQPVAKQSVAERLMAKMGWQSGQGLGARGQGIKQALVAKKDGGSGHLKIAEPGPKPAGRKRNLSQN